jgi:hypothetical protein
MLDGVPSERTQDCINIHLIRHPARVIASYTAKCESSNLEDIGYGRQTALYEKIGALVIDSHDIRQNSDTALRRLCDATDLTFDDAMQAWPAGPKPFDGVCASHRYGAVHSSTGFAGPEGALPRLMDGAANLCAKALPLYDALKAHKLQIAHPNPA